MGKAKNAHECLVMMSAHVCRVFTLSPAAGRAGCGDVISPLMADQSRRHVPNIPILSVHCVEETVNGWHWREELIQRHFDEEKKCWSQGHYIHICIQTCTAANSQDSGSTESNGKTKFEDSISTGSHDKITFSEEPGSHDKAKTTPQGPHDPRGK